MAASSSPKATLIATIFLILIMITTPLHEISAQAPPFASTPLMVDCGTRLLSLAPCGPYVQGSAPAPTQQCCDSLALIYSQEPRCLCLFLSAIALRSLPFNATLALDLPGVCSPQMSPAICSGGGPAPPTPPPVDPVVSGVNSSFSPSPVLVSATPTVTVTPIPSNLLGFGQSSGHHLNGGGYLTLMLALITTLLLMIKELY
ncbi:hypothetical protein V2J09_020407 [Rumex salicifolius]